MAYPQPPPAPPRAPKPPPSMRRIGIIVAAVAGLVALIGIAAAVAPNDNDPAPPTSTTAAPAGPTTTTTPDPVLTSIAAETDCTALQAAFDQADTNHDPALARGNQEAAERTVDIMKAADARMQELGCS